MENLLNDLKDLILCVKNKGELLKQKGEFFQKWDEKRLRVEKAMMELSHKEREVLDAEYKIWYGREISPKQKTVKGGERNGAAS